MWKEWFHFPKRTIRRSVLLVIKVKRTIKQIAFVQVYETLILFNPCRQDNLGTSTLACACLPQLQRNYFSYQQHLQNHASTALGKIQHAFRGLPQVLVLILSYLHACAHSRYKDSQFARV